MMFIGFVVALLACGRPDNIIPLFACPSVLFYSSILKKFTIILSYPLYYSCCHDEYFVLTGHFLANFDLVISHRLSRIESTG